MLDLQSVRLLVLAAEYGNLTRAAEAAGTVQPVVSARIKALEVRMGRRLLDRSPRIVKLTDAGASFLQHAKAMLSAHDAALVDDDADSPSVSLGISDHVFGTSLPAVLRSLRLVLPARTRLTVRLGMSHEMRDLYLGVRWILPSSGGTARPAMARSWARTISIGTGNGRTDCAAKPCPSAHIYAGDRTFAGPRVRRVTARADPSSSYGRHFCSVKQMFSMVSTDATAICRRL